MRVKPQPEPEKTPAPKPAPFAAQSQPTQPQPETPQPQPADTAPSAATQPDTTQLGNGSKKTALAVVAAIVAIFVYTYWTELRAWYVEAQAGHAVTISIQPKDIEQTLSSQIMNDLAFDSGERKKFNEIETVYIKEQIPQPIPIPVVDLHQQRAFQKHCWKAVRDINQLFEEQKDNSVPLYKKIKEKGMLDDAFLAYQLKKETKYLQMWKNAWLLLIQEHKSKMQHWQEIALMEKLAYFNQTSFQRHPALKTLAAYAFRRLKEKRDTIQTRADAARLLYASYFFPDTAFGKTLSEKAYALLSDKSQSWKNLQDQGDCLQFMMKYLTLKKEDMEKIPAKHLNFIHRLCQDVAILLEPDGCLPQIDGIENRINLREPLFHAAQLFDRDDFRFIAYGGLRMPDSHPPAICSVYLRQHSKCVMRSGWNICYHIDPVVRKWLGDDQVSLTMDTEKGEISIYGYNHPLCIIRNPGFGTVQPTKTIWKTDQNKDYLYLETTARTMEIYFIKEFRTWVVREKLKKSTADPTQDIYFYRSQIDKINDNTLLSHRYIRIVWSHDKHLRNKQTGNVYIHSANTPLLFKKVSPKPEGCYWQAQRRLDNENELIVTAVPYVRPAPYEKRGSSLTFRKDISFSFVENMGDRNYRAFHLKRDTYKKLVYQKVPLDKSKPAKSILLSQGRIEVKPMVQGFTQN